MPRVTLLSSLISLGLLVSLVTPGVTTSQILARFQPAPAAQSTDLCPSLPPPSGNIVNVSTEAGLWNAVNTAQEGDTILLADGTYNLGQSGYYVWIDTPNVTLRSSSGNREGVVLDDNYNGTEIITILASNVTIADLTIKRAGTHPIHVTSSDSGDTENTLIYNVHIVDPGQQAIKINPHAAKVYFPDDGEIACSHIELTDAGRAEVWNINGNCYTGGIDAHQAQGWVIRDNTIEGFWCPGNSNGSCSGTGEPNELSEHAIHLWTGSRDTIVERNVLLDNARGVGFGLGESPWGDPWRTYSDNPCSGAYPVGHYDGVIRNNFIFASRGELFSSDCGSDCGICLEQACGVQVLHNSVVSTDSPTSSSVEWRFSNTDVEIINNLVSHNLLEREGNPSANLDGNLDYQPLTLFVDGTGGDLHLAATATTAIDHGVSVTSGLCDDDIDGDTRPIGSARDIGADEYGVPAPAAVTDLRVTMAVTDSSTLTATLRWTPPTDAVTTTLRHSLMPITESGWATSSLLTDTLPGGTGAFTATVPYEGGTAYFALKSQNAGGDSDLSNNAFWPRFDVYLPLSLRAFGP